MVRAEVIDDLVQPGARISISPELGYREDEGFLNDVLGVFLGQAVPVGRAPDEGQEVLAMEVFEGGP